MANGDIHKLGTLWVSDSKKATPTQPWGKSEGGNICEYNEYSGSGKIEIRNTSPDDAYKLRWIEVNGRSGKKLLISDRVILAAVSWDQLNARDLIKGKKTTIDGQEYLLRVLTGGNDLRIENMGASGGVLPNEWDEFICNEGNYPGLPKPNSTDLASGPNDSQKTTEHNRMWNWYSVFSWCQEVQKDSPNYHPYRGYGSAMAWAGQGGNNRKEYMGWRPVLEVLNAAPTISGEDTDLGIIKGNTYTKAYNVSDSDGDAFSIEEKVDGELIRRLENQTDGQFTLDLSSNLSSLAYTSHAITITATDSKGASNVRTWTFQKVNAAPKAPIITKPSNNERLDIVNFETFFTPNMDEDYDDQYISIEVADDSEFLQNKKVANDIAVYYWDAVEGWIKSNKVDQSNIVRKWKLVCKDIALADKSEKYIRIGTTDKIGDHQIAWSNYIKVKTLNKLEFSTQPISLDYQPTGANVTINATIDARATTSVLVTNNANDPEPVWEDMTQEWKEDEFHTFVNKSQTAGWAVAYKVIVNANDATGEISVSEMLMGVK